MGDNKFWLRLWQSVIFGSVIVAISTSGCTMHQNVRIGEAIKNGASPIQAKLAFGSNTNMTETITALLTEGR